VLDADADAGGGSTGTAGANELPRNQVARRITETWTSRLRLAIFATRVCLSVCLLVVLFASAMPVFKDPYCWLVPIVQVQINQCNVRSGT
jgi:hypothetical protein